MRKMILAAITLLILSCFVMAQNEAKRSAIESKDGFERVTLTNPGSAELADYYFYGDTQTMLSSSNGGYVAGINGYGDLGKYQRFDTPDGGNLTSVGLYFGAATVVGTADALTLVIKEATGTGELDPPGTTIYSESFTTADITSLTSALVFEFTTPIAVDANFFVGFEWGPAADDELSLFHDASGEGDGAFRSWEKWNDNTYWAFDNASSWDEDVDLWVEATIDAGGGDVVFEDDFEFGTTKWVLEGTWGLSTTQANSPTHSLSESPTGNYADNLNISATMAQGVDLSSALGAELAFYMRHAIEEGFDYMYVEITTNGTNWIELDAIDANNSSFELYSYDIGGFVGFSDVKIRFRFFSDVGFNLDGAYIDDVTITTSNDDFSPPLVLHTGPSFYQGVKTDYEVVATISDVSGIASAEVYYTVDGGTQMSVGPSNVNGDEYTFTIPAAFAGEQVDYFITATDNANNTVQEPRVWKYIAGEHVFYDDPEVSFVNVIGPTSQSGLTGCAVRLTVPQDDNILVYALIRNYTDSNRPNDTFMFHVWDDNGGLPGADLITPFEVVPEATLQVTSPMTRIDLRPYLSLLSGLDGDIHIGFTVASGDEVWLTQFTPGTTLRTSTLTGSAWTVISDDYHFRGIFGNLGNVPVELTSFTAAQHGSKVVLEWETATETNNQGFEVQRQIVNGEEVSDWQVIAYKEGVGTTTEKVKYVYEDDILGINASNIRYRLKQVDFDGRYEFSDVIEIGSVIPLSYDLYQNYPNPFNPSTKITFDLPVDNFVSLKIFNLLGQEVAELVNGFRSAGKQVVEFNAENLTSGLYFYVLRAGNDNNASEFISTKKMMLIK